MHPVLAILALALASSSVEQDVYRTLPLGELVWQTENPPTLERDCRDWDIRGWPRPYFTLEGAGVGAGEGAGEAFFGVPWHGRSSSAILRLRECVLSVRSAHGATLRGVMILPEGGGFAGRRYAFRIPPGKSDGGGRVRFLQYRYLHYRSLCHPSILGGAWFRRQAQATRELLADLGEAVPRLAVSDSVVEAAVFHTQLEHTFDLWSGGRALAESLALGDMLEPTGDELPTHRLDQIEGVTTPAVNWAARDGDDEPELDPLARLVPFDQHAVFFASCGALVRVLDEVPFQGAPFLDLHTARSQDTHTRERYERQLCLPLGRLARQVGGRGGSSVAITGGDPYLRTGSDVAVLFQRGEPRLSERFLLGRHRIAEDGGAQRSEGRLHGIPWRGVSTADRTISSYLMRLDEGLVVANSLRQLERIASVAAGELACLADQEEYVGLRRRQPRSEDGEDAFLVVTATTIRRWCSPRWRIGASRRIRAAAILADHQARDLASVLEGDIPMPGVVSAEIPMPGGGALRRTEDGLQSDVFGTLAFMTPIGELEIEWVTAAEQRAYEDFRTEYRGRWRGTFGSCAARVTLEPEQLEVDVSVVPFRIPKQYWLLEEITRGAKLSPTRPCGEFERGAPPRVSFAAGPEFSDGLLGGAGSDLPWRLFDPMAWIGPEVECLFDPDPRAWAGVRWNSPLTLPSFGAPIAMNVTSKDPLRLTAFLAGVRAMLAGLSIDIDWSIREYGTHRYVSVGNFIYFLATPDGLLLTIDEEVLQHLMDDAERRSRREAQGASRPRLGGTVSVCLPPGSGAMLEAWIGRDWASKRKQIAWGALPILNEWRQLRPGIDAVRFHLEHWGVEPTCPDGGDLVWNDEWSTYESSLLGHPGDSTMSRALPPSVRAMQSAELGLTLEENGVRLRVVVDR